MSLVKIRAALETALNALPGMIPAVAIVGSVNGVFTTQTPHLLQTGLNVSIKGHTVLNGVYLVVVLDASTFTLQDEVTLQAVGAGVSGSGGTVQANLTAWEGVSFKPVLGVPYQEVFLLAANPQNPTYDAFYREMGYLQVGVYYPSKVGTYDSTTRAELIRSTFKRGNTFTKDEIVVHIQDTPILQQWPISDEFTCVVVKIPYWSDIFS